LGRIDVNIVYKNYLRPKLTKFLPSGKTTVSNSI